MLPSAVRTNSYLVPWFKFLGMEFLNNIVTLCCFFEGRCTGFPKKVNYFIGAYNRCPSVKVSRGIHEMCQHFLLLPLHGSAASSWAENCEQTHLNYRKTSWLGVCPHETAGHQAWGRKLNCCWLTVTVGEHEFGRKLWASVCFELILRTSVMT